MHGTAQYGTSQLIAGLWPLPLVRACDDLKYADEIGSARRQQARPYERSELVLFGYPESFVVLRGTSLQHGTACMAKDSRNVCH